ncbi:MAG TPA: hypothetical protein VLC91_07455 [Spongiibacteraceae bacterium]|nr:hypothetical protein [Spongiibacteraceae bacterium]
MQQVENQLVFDFPNLPKVALSEIRLPHWGKTQLGRRLFAALATAMGEDKRKP